MTILVMTTGGTIGARPHPDPQNPPKIITPDAKDLIGEALKDKKFAFAKTRCVPLEARDSKLIDEPYRENMLKIVAEAPERQILITHGTDTILQTANFFYRMQAVNPALSGKFIILTGAMVPLTNGPESDGYLNLKFALEQLTHFSTDPYAQARSDVAHIYIVLCDFESPESESGAWKPRLYDYRPRLYEKAYMADGRYNRLRRVK